MSSNHNLKNPDHRVADLDGVRAIAIWMVLLLHVLFAFPNGPGALNFIPGPILLILSHGWLGVDLFFMLSGFLITGILMGSKHNSHYFRNFYVRRVLRIMPLYFATVLVWSILYRGYGQYFLLSSVFGANLARLLHIRYPHGPGVLWSLAIEEHFYLLWPLVVFLLNKRNLAIVTGAIFLLTPAVRAIAAAQGVSSDLIYLLSWFRFDGLAAGALMAIWARSYLAGRRSSIWIASLLMVAFVLLTVIGAPFGLMGTKTVTSIALRYTQAYLFFGAFFVLVVAFRATRWTAPLRWRFMQLSGALSYCLYLVHLSVGDGYEYLLKRSGVALVSYVGAFGEVLVRGAAILAVSFGIALLSRKYLEDPFLSLKDRFTEADALKPRAQVQKAVGAASPAESLAD
jgi:peptidoglycan/LPS O-acetylase OafA/YrhL